MGVPGAPGAAGAAGAPVGSGVEPLRYGVKSHLQNGQAFSSMPPMAWMVLPHSGHLAGPAEAPVSAGLKHMVVLLSRSGDGGREGPREAGRNRRGLGGRPACDPAGQAVRGS
ncbi:hypothetical protein D1643_05520 [Enterorhabdus sp. P55]|nr:hypothetical protein [Enterorhabdus sp. P55]